MSSSRQTVRVPDERMKSDFVSFVSHQLRTPLAGINWMLELAAETPGLPADARTHIEDARASAARLVSLVNDLVDISRIESGRIEINPEPIALDRLTREIAEQCSPLVSAKGQTLEIAAADVPTVEADRPMMRQVVINLLSNAIRYTPQAGRIDIAVAPQNGFVRWTIRDSGIGIPQNAHSRLFEKFFRADNVFRLEPEGAGLGLSLARLIVERFGGRIWCESKEGCGAQFTFTVPIPNRSGTHA
jgi:signal transduction histidine kinase